jgi:hypothetical protein
VAVVTGAAAHVLNTSSIFGAGAVARRAQEILGGTPPATPFP